MKCTSLIGPAIVAAAISGLVSGIGISISAPTARRIHTEKLAFDRDQAGRRAAAEIAVDECKTMADIALPERKLALDRALAPVPGYSRVSHPAGERGVKLPIWEMSDEQFGVN